MGRILSATAAAWLALASGSAGAAVSVERVYETPGSSDQDDMCLWIHPAEAGQSTVVTSDKTAGHIYVYDLEGQLLQSISSPKPGNIDVRYGIQLGGECVDLIALNERTEHKIRVYRVDPVSRLLERVDNGAIVTGPNYGFALARREDGALTGVTGPAGASSTFRQYELVDDGTGQVRGAATGWQIQASTVEGMVSDDDAGWLFLAEEDVGIWRVAIDDAQNRTLVAAVGGSGGLGADVEGLTLYHLAGARGYLIASSQAANRFEVFAREPPHAPIGDFTILGVGESDGIDVTNVAPGGVFDAGLFAFHNGQDCCPVQAASWGAIATQLALEIDTSSWQPRRTCGPHLRVTPTALEWSAASPALTYDVVRGELGPLHATGGAFASAITGCLANDTPALSLPYVGAPGPGQGEWYVVRGVASFGPLSYDSYGAEQPASRDPGLAAACP